MLRRRGLGAVENRGRDFLMCLVAQHGLAGAARMLRALADELAFLSYLSSMVTKGFRPSRPRH